MTLLLLTKRQLKKPAIWLILLLIPCFAFAMSYMAAQSDTGVSIALYAEKNDTFSQALVTKLTTAQEGMFTFYLCDTRDAVYEAVATGKAECGYLFADSMLQTLDAGRRNSLIDVIISSDSLFYPVVNEIVYSAFFESYSLHMLQNYFSQTLPQLSVSPKTIASVYDGFLNDGSTFSFTYVNTPEVPEFRADIMLLLSVKGMFFLLILLAGLTGGLSYYDDRDNHIYDVLVQTADGRCRLLRSVLTQKNKLHIAVIAIPALFCTVMGYLSTILWLPYETLISELLSFVILFLGAVLLPLIFHLFFRSRNTYTAALLFTIPIGAVLLLI